MVPVIGLLQIGVGNGADRFTCLAQIGLTIALAWTAADACRTWPRFRRVWAAAATCALMVLVVLAWRQTCYWHDSVTLWRHALACTSKNSMAHNNLATFLASRGRTDEAVAHYRKALEIEPAYADADYNLGNALSKQGLLDEAMAHYRKALEIQPAYANAHLNLGNALAKRGLLDNATAHYRKALVLAKQQKNEALVETLEAWLRLYGAGTPDREPQQPSEH